MTQNLSNAEQALRDAAREYHRSPNKGKISVTPVSYTHLTLPTNREV